MTEHQFFGKDAPLFAPNACAVSQQLPLHQNDRLLRIP
jgi:hypothetical protein